jgi:hypothetical protein
MEINMKTNKLNKIVEKSVNTALEFYEDNGITFNYRPKVRYVDEYYISYNCKKKYSTVAIANAFRGLKEYIFYEDMPKKSKEELIKRHEYLNKKYCYDFDILLFKPYGYSLKYPYDLSPQKFSDGVFIHELAHLFERDKNLVFKHHLISEGIAYLTEKLFLKEELPFVPEKDSSFYEDRLEYSKKVMATNILYYEVRNSENPIKTLFQIPLRDKVQKEVMSTLLQDPTLR